MTEKIEFVRPGIHERYHPFPFLYAPLSICALGRCRRPKLHVKPRGFGAICGSDIAVCNSTVHTVQVSDARGVKTPQSADRVRCSRLRGHHIPVSLEIRSLAERVIRPVRVSIQKNPSVA